MERPPPPPGFAYGNFVNAAGQPVNIPAGLVGPRAPRQRNRGAPGRGLLPGGPPVGQRPVDMMAAMPVPPPLPVYGAVPPPGLRVAQAGFVGPNGQPANQALLARLGARGGPAAAGAGPAAGPEGGDANDMDEGEFGGMGGPRRRGGKKKTRRTKKTKSKRRRVTRSRRQTIRYYVPTY
jgi:hypothetical protein